MKTFLSLFLAVTMLFFVVSCADINSSDKSNTSATTTTPTTPNTTSGTTASTTTGKTDNSPKEKTMNIKIASYNIKHGELANHDFDVIAEDIIKNDIEIIGLQEVDQNTNRNGKQDTMGHLADATDYYYCYAASLENYQGGQYGNGILSKYPIVAHETIKLPKKDPNNAKEEQRTVLHAQIDIGGEIFHFFTTHFQGNAAELQFAEINKHSKNCEFFVVAGDYNRQDFEIYSAIENSYLSHKGEVTTVDGYKFDNFIISNNIKSKNFTVTDTRNSDHYMITTEISVTFKTK